MNIRWSRAERAQVIAEAARLFAQAPFKLEGKKVRNLPGLLTQAQQVLPTARHRSPVQVAASWRDQLMTALNSTTPVSDYPPQDPAQEAIDRDARPTNVRSDEPACQVIGLPIPASADTLSLAELVTALMEKLVGASAAYADSVERQLSSLHDMVSKIEQRTAHYGTTRAILDRRQPHVEKERLPVIIVMGLLPEQAQHVREKSAGADLRFVRKDTADLPPHWDYAIIVKFNSHKDTITLPPTRTERVRFVNGTTKTVEAVAEFVAKHQAHRG